MNSEFKNIRKSREYWSALADGNLPIRILFLDHEDDSAFLQIYDILSDFGDELFKMECEHSFEGAQQRLADEDYHLFFIHDAVVPADGIGALCKTGAHPDFTPAVLITSADSLYEPEAANVDACDFIEREKIDSELLARIIRHALSYRGLLHRIAPDISGKKLTSEALSESEAKFRELFSNMNSGAAIFTVRDFGRRFIFKDLNHACERIEGISRDEALDRNILEVLPAFRDLGIFEILYEVWKDGQARSFGPRYFRSNLKEGWREGHVCRLPDGELAIIYEDITERIAAEHALRESEEKYRAIFDNVRDMVYTGSSDGRILSINAAFERITGWPINDWLGRELKHLIHPEDRERVSARLADCLNGCDIDPFEMRILSKLREYKTLEFMPTPMYDGGRIVGLFGIARDITERKVAERSALLQKELAIKLSAASSLDSALEACMEAAIQVAGMDCGGVYLLNEDTEDMELAVSYGLSSRFEAEVYYVPRDSSRWNVVMKGDAIFTTFDELRTDQSFAESNEKLKAIAILPVKNEGRVIACLNAASHLLNEIGQTARDGLEAIAAQIGSAIARLKAEEAQRNNEIKYRNIFNNAQIGLFRSTLDDGVVLECNDRFAQIFGYGSADECMTDFVTSEHYVDIADRERMIAELMALGEIKNYEARIRGADGAVRWVRYSARIYKDKGYMEGVAADITKEKSAFNMLRKSSRGVANILESISDGFYTLDKDLTITYFNKAAEIILNRRSSEVLRKNIYEVFPQFKRTILASEYERVLKEKTASSFEVRLDLKPYQDWYDVRIYPGEDGISVYFHEITERKHYEQILLDKEHRLSAILNSAADGIFVIDQEGIIDSVNPAAGKIFGCQQADLESKNISRLMPVFMERLGEYSEHEPDNRSQLEFETEGVRGDGSGFSLRAAVKKMILDGRSLYTVIIHDLTDERERMRKLMEIDKYSAIGTLAAGVAHEFKNYLAGIIGNASFAIDNLVENDDNALTRELLQQVVDIGENANRIALSLLTYSQMKPDKKSSENVNSLIMNVLKLINKEVRACNIRIETDFQELPELYISSGKIQQMILNVVLNAKQAIGKEGTISIRSRDLGGHVSVQIGDDGSGMSPEVLERIFDPFFSTKGVWGKDKYHGAGLGLSISRNIAIEHGGQITVDSLVGKGTVVTIQLPVPAEQIRREHKSKGPVNAMALFSADEETIVFYRNLCGEQELELRVLSSLDDLAQEPVQNVLFVFDAEYPAQGELHRLAEYCALNDISYIVINSASASERQLEGLTENAISIYSGLPKSIDRQFIESQIP